MTRDTILVLLIGAACGAFFILLFQHLFPQRARWRLVGCALVSGILITSVFALFVRHVLEPTPSAIKQVANLLEAAQLATFRAALPEEAVKGLAALLALLPFRRRATPSEAFQAALFAAIGFAAVENRGYASAFSEYGLVIALGRGLMATFVHAALAMTFGLFLMRFVAGGWTRWHLLLLGYLAASACHAVHNTGLILVGSELFRTRTVALETMISAVPIIIAGFGTLLVCGLWSLRVATRRAAANDPITAEPGYQVLIRRWRRGGNILLALGVLCIGAPLAWAAAMMAPAGDPADLLPGMNATTLIVGGVCAGLFALLLGWVLRQKR